MGISQEDKLIIGYINSISIVEMSSLIDNNPKYESIQPIKYINNAIIQLV